MYPFWHVSLLQSAAYWTWSTLELRKEKACVVRWGGTHAGHLRMSESADLANMPFGAKRQAGAWLTKVPREESLGRQQGYNDSMVQADLSVLRKDLAAVASVQPPPAMCVCLCSCKRREHYYAVYWQCSLQDAPCS